MPDLRRLFGSPVEERYRIDVDLPRGVRGRVFLNAPARFELGGERADHWLDGDGMIMSLTLGVDGAEFARRYIRTRKWQVEEEAGRRLFRGIASPAGGACASPCNVSVHRWAGRLLACGEYGLPCQLECDSLETVGEWDGGGVLPGQPQACMRLEPHGDRLVVACVDETPALHLFEFAEDERLLWKRVVPLPHPHACPDIAVTDRWVVIHLSPLCVDRTRLSHGGTVREALYECAAQSHLLLAERGGDFTGCVRIAPGYLSHFIDCFDSGPFVAVNLIEGDGPLHEQLGPLSALFHSVKPARPVRYVVDAPALEVVERGALGYGAAPAFPTTAPDSTGQEFWALGISRCGVEGAKFYDQLMHARWTSPFVEDVHTVDGLLGGEPIWVGGHVLVQHFDGTRSAFLVYEADRVAGGPVAKIPLRTPTPFGLHHSGVEPWPPPRT